MKLTLLVILVAIVASTACVSKLPSDTTISNDNAVEALRSELVSDADAVKNALNVGATMPAFTLKDVEGKDVSSNELLTKGNLVLVFYRGAWCPFCNLYLQQLQQNAKAINEAGGQIVAISIETPDGSASVARKNELKFVVLSDPQFNTARKFGLVYQLPRETDETYKSKGLDVAKHNQMEKAELPLAATYIIDRKGEIKYVFLDTDYKKRAEPEVVIENLLKLKDTEK